MVHFPPGIIPKILSFLPPYHPCRCNGRCTHRHKKPNHINCLDTADTLRKMLKDMHCKTGGTKAALVKRLFDAGGKARRPYWDTKKNAVAMRRKPALRRPLLTFDKKLHSAEAWNHHLAEIVDCMLTLPTQDANARTPSHNMHPLPVQHHSYYDDIQIVTRMHGTYIRQMRATAAVEGYKLMRKAYGVDPLAHDKRTVVRVSPYHIHPRLEGRFKTLAVIQRPTSDGQPYRCYLAWRSVEPYTMFTY